MFQITQVDQVSHETHVFRTRLAHGEVRRGPVAAIVHFEGVVPVRGLLQLNILAPSGYSFLDKGRQKVNDLHRLLSVCLHCQAKARIGPVPDVVLLPLGSLRGQVPVSGSRVHSAPQLVEDRARLRYGAVRQAGIIWCYSPGGPVG